MTIAALSSLPSYDGAELVIPAPGAGPGNWAGAASAVLVDGVFWLTWRNRRPLSDGRGVTVSVARSTDGVRFETVTEVHRDQFGCESLERPVLVPLPEGGWRLYLSCATWDSKHWWVDSLTADTVPGLPEGNRQVIHPGSDAVAVKDPVIAVDPVTQTWQMWLCCHPLTEPGHEDRMTTRYLTSTDGLEWHDGGEVLAGRPGRWDARGARVTTVVSRDPLVILYDGRADAESNWYETTGVARWDGSRLVADAEAAPVTSPHSDGAFRYASAVPLPDGGTRYYVEAAREDGAHDLITLVR
ncbi:hypothetical protein [Nocardioides albus]|uniref:Uncharacterized protein n=1 Tax=Nocardioides albus TaxID=1841 RepID=A0A7W5A726_9ACTN|nr:hypothetical protein [Nocardioides albus]MBB3090723.1 hypothetical protein [Nocardioides albus]